MDIPVPIQAAIVGSSASIIVLLAKDLLIQRLQEKNKEKKNEISIYRTYADPISQAVESLLWRLREIFYDQGRGAYLKSKQPETQFAKYKQTSTLYRIACLLGWIRALKRELSYLQVGEGESFNSVSRAIQGFESALADGPHIEQKRLRGLAKLWKIELPDEQDEQYKLGIALDQYIDQEMLSEKRVDIPSDLPDDLQLILCKGACTLICECLSVEQIIDEEIEENVGKAIREMSIMEAWIYRDWQTAIGDLMVKETKLSNRNFEVIGYGEFEDIFVSNNSGEKLWVERLKEMIEGVDVSSDGEFDARIGQLRQVMKSCARMIISFSKVKQLAKSISTDTLNLALEIDKKAA